VRRPLRDIGHGRIVRLPVLAWPRMRREILPGYELDDDRDRIDVAAVHRFLSEEAYWALGRPFDTVALLVRNSYRVLGLYHDGALVGYCRAVSDGAVHAYLADVYVLDAYRGRGLGLELVREIVENSFGEVRWMLNTADAQGLYERLGFSEEKPPYPLMERAPRRAASVKPRR
jgi:ribosomal protein S18 acetylase RimI-like enzyme